MNIKNLYIICENLGLDKNYINKTLNTVLNNKQDINIINKPADCYKDPSGGRYGTISIKNFK